MVQEGRRPTGEFPRRRRAAQALGQDPLVVTVRSWRQRSPLLTTSSRVEAGLLATCYCAGALAGGVVVAGTPGSVRNSLHEASRTAADSELVSASVRETGAQVVAPGAGAQSYASGRVVDVAYRWEGRPRRVRTTALNADRWRADEEVERTAGGPLVWVGRRTGRPVPAPLEAAQATARALAERLSALAVVSILLVAVREAVVATVGWWRGRVIVRDFVRWSATSRRRS